MASIPLVKSESEIQNLSDNSVIVFDVNIPSDEDFTEDTEVEADDMSEFDDCKSINSENRSASGESTNQTLLSPDVHSYMSESEGSPIPYRKKRPAPLPPNMSPSVATRHSYAFDSTAARMRTSTDTESNTSESRLFYQTSTDSESLAMPESARGSNFPGELAGVDNLYAITKTRPLSEDISQSPRGLSKLSRLREVFRSPQIGRRKTMREEKSGREKILRVRKPKAKDGSTPDMKRSKVGEGNTVKPTRLFDPVPRMSNWVMAAGYDDLDIDQEFEVKRVLDYEKFLSELLEETDNYHVDYVDISRSLIRVRSMMKEREEEISNEDDTVMDTVELRSSQDDLSTDNLTTNCRDNVDTHNSSNNNNINNNNNNDDSGKLSGRKLSARRKSAPSALLFKSLASMKARSPTSVWYNAGLGKKDQDVIAQFKLADGDTDRAYVAEGSVQFAAGMQVQDRYLFLFTDLLLVTKQKSTTTFKLKQKVHLCDMWIASCVEDVSEITRPMDRSFVIGWPTTNVAATFPSVETKDDWLSKFSQNITKQKIKEEHKSLQVKVIPKDIEGVTCSSCQMAVDVFTQAKDMVLECLKQAGLPDADPKDYQLWVLAGKDSSPYPLIGHETPYSIKYSQARELSRSRSANDLDNMTAVDLDTIVENISTSSSKCEFYLKQKLSPTKGQSEDSSHHKPMKKHKKTQNIFNTIFRKKRIFGLPLAKICDKNLDPPEGIIKLMVQVYQYGPHTPGILRRGNNTLLGKEIKEKIKAGDKYTLEDHMTPTAASVFKEFLRCIPEGLLVCSLHEQWLSIKKDDPHEEKINKIKTLLAKLPAENLHMLKLTICLLQHLAKHCSVNHMGPSNLATCIAPSLFVQRANGSSHGKWKGGDVQKQMQESVCEIQEVIVPLLSFIIIHHLELFGEDILSLFVKYGCQASPAVSLDDRYDGQIQPSADEEEEEEDMSADEDDVDNFSAELTDEHHRVQLHPGKVGLMRDSNSGTDSDSMHSVLSLQDGGMGLHHDDSSIDSLGDRDYYSHESPKATKSHLSPSNLSRDSGLTLSDNQLYDEESYQADIASTSAKMFQAKMSIPDLPDLASNYPGSCRQTTSSQTDKDESPIPPPRKRSMRRKAYNVNSDGHRHGFVESSPQWPPLKHSTSAAYLDDSLTSAAHKEQRHMVPFPTSANQKVSDLTGKEQEATDKSLNIQTMKARTDIGMLIKSASGSHLYLNENIQATEFALQPIKDAAEPVLMRGSSVNGHSVPVSPQSRHSHSSGDSVISSSIYSTSRDGSINSAPQTPEESPDLSQSWIPDISLPGKPWDILLHGTNTAQPQTQAQSSNLFSRNETSCENMCVDTSSVSPSVSLRKLHEAEEGHFSRKPHFSLMNDYSENSSHSFAKNPPLLSSIQHGKQRFSAYLELGSPPPNVILQTLQTSALKELVAVPAADAQHRRYSVDSSEPRKFHFSKEMQSIRHEEYLHVRSTPVTISPEGESCVAAGATSKTTLSKFIRANDFVLPLSKQHGDRPLNYQQVQRHVMMKYNEPDDITEEQRAKSARAKAMYEKSLQLFQNDSQPTDNQGPNSKSNLVVSSDLAFVTKSKPLSEIEDRKNGRQGHGEHMDSHTTDYTPHDSFHSAVMSDDLDDSGASGFLDLSSVSLSLERDIIGGHKPRAESDASSFSRSLSPGNLLSISRNESRLSDTDSSGSSTVTVSTLSQLSDSFNCHSDLSNTSSVTVSSVTSSDSNPDLCSRSAHRRSGGNCVHDLSPVVPRNKRSERSDINMVENEGEVNQYSDSLKKDPKEIYLQSMQIYEQKSSHGVSSPVSKCALSWSSHEVSSSVSQRVSPSFFPAIKKPLSSPQFSNVPKLHTSAVAPVSSSQKSAPMAATSVGRPAESKARLSLDGPSVNLHRSCSDISKHAHKQGSYSSRSTNVGQDDLADVKEKRSSVTTGKGTQQKFMPNDVKSEYQQNFIRAKSCFHRADAIKNTFSDSAPRHSVQCLQQKPSAQEARPGKLHKPILSTTAEPTAVSLSVDNPSAVSPSALSPGSTTAQSPTTDSSSLVNKREFPWSVKVLKSKYDTGSSTNTHESTSTHSHPQSPSPLRNPSSSRQQGSPQRSRSNSSSSTEPVSSCNTSPKTSVSFRHGPQSYPCEASHYSYSSSDDSSSSSPKRTTWLSGSSFDSEELSDYTNTTYI